jgi:CheY-like chemotaxis protein
MPSTNMTTFEPTKPQPQYTILIVDNETDWQDHVQSALSECLLANRFIYQKASTYAEALILIHQANPVIAILDLNLKHWTSATHELEGWKLAKLLKEKNVPVIMLTVFSDRASIKRSYKELEVEEFFDKGKFVQEREGFLNVVMELILNPQSINKNNLEYSAEYLSQIRKHLTEHYSLTELKELCFDIGVNNELLGGESQSVPDLALNLLNYVKRRNLLDKLVGFLNLPPYT